MPIATCGSLAIFEHKHTATGRSANGRTRNRAARTVTFYDAWTNLPEKTAMIPMRAVPPREGLWRRLFAYGANCIALEQPHLLRLILVFA